MFVHSRARKGAKEIAKGKRTRKEVLEIRAYWNKKKRESRGRKSDKERKAYKKYKKDVACEKVVEQIKTIFKNVTPNKKKNLAKRNVLSPKSMNKSVKAREMDTEIVDCIVKERDRLKRRRDTTSRIKRSILTHALQLPMLQNDLQSDPSTCSDPIVVTSTDDNATTDNNATNILEVNELTTASCNTTDDDTKPDFSGKATEKTDSNNNMKIESPHESNCANPMSDISSDFDADRLASEETQNVINQIINEDYLEPQCDAGNSPVFVVMEENTF